LVCNEDFAQRWQILAQVWNIEGWNLSCAWRDGVGCDDAEDGVTTKKGRRRRRVTRREDYIQTEEEPGIVYWSQSPSLFE